MKSYKPVAHAALALLLSIVFLPALVAAKSRSQPELLVVYWSAPDCPWCAWWETHSGLKQKFEKSPEFQRLTFRTIRKPSLSDPYSKEHYPADLAWLAERMARQEESPPSLPQTWSVSIDCRPLFTATGSKQWEQNVWPEIKKLAQRHHNGGSQ